MAVMLSGESARLSFRRRLPFLAFACLAVALLLADNLFLRSMASSWNDQQENPIPNVRALVSPVCLPRFGTKDSGNKRRIRRIYFLHMRKAGGTTIRYYLGRVARHYHLEIAVDEATPTEMPGSRNDTLYVTHLRHPVGRVISQFKYEGRWSCGQLVKNQTYVPTLENANDFQSWIEENECSYTGSNKGGSKLWKCSTNCFIQWLTLTPDSRKQGCITKHPSVINAKFAEAQAVLSKFDLVIDTERLRLESYARKIENYFGQRGLVGQKHNMYCGKQSTAANQKNPLSIANSTLEDLYERNGLDLELFRRFTECEGPTRFPTTNLTNHIL